MGESKAGEQIEVKGGRELSCKVGGWVQLSKRSTFWDMGEFVGVYELEGLNRG